MRNTDRSADLSAARSDRSWKTATGSVGEP